MTPAGRTLAHTLGLLAGKGLRYATVIDLGCADGQFFVEFCLRGHFRDSIPLNVDPNPLYEPSLKLIQETLGGHYRIAAASDRSGEIELITAAHPYWSSTRADDNFYWDRVNHLKSGRTIVPAVRLDDLAAELRLSPPYLLKLDVQGSEVQALRGARKLLDDTNVVICEADMVDFQAINGELAAAGFDLYDITHLSYAADHSLGWFYPIYLHSRLAKLVPRRIWSDADNAAVIQVQVARRQAILAGLPDVLAKIKAAQAKGPG
jgi:FkbM family methyltransferase